MVDDTQAMEMTLVTAKDKNWTRCPNCNEWIEKVVKQTNKKRFFFAVLVYLT
jgi:uncharacterized protein with PIN domain